MAFWDFQDTRYKGAREKLILSLAALVLTSIALPLLLWTRSAPPSAAKAGTADSLAATPLPPGPDQLRLARVASLRSKLEEAFAARDDNKVDSLAAEILAIEPGDPTTWSLLGIVRDRRGDHAGAMECYGKAVDFSNAQPFYLFLRARAHRMGGNFAAAVSDLEEAARGDPASVGMANTLLIAKIEAGMADEVGKTVAAYETARIHEHSGLWLLGAAALSLHDGNPLAAARYLEGFQSKVDPALYEELIADPFFDPYRSEAALAPFFHRMRAGGH